MCDHVATAAAVAADPVQGKVLLALVGALFGWGIKAVWDEYKQRQRWRRLAPVVLRQLRSAADAFGAAFDLQRLPRAATKLTSAQASAIELVAAGVRESDWLMGLELIADCLDAAQVAETAPQDRRPESFEAMRIAGKALTEWAARMRA